MDGSLVATHTVTFPQNLRVIASEFNSGGPELTVDWMRMSPYPGSGAFTSRVFDAGQAADWGALTWNSAAPSGTGVALSVRTGNTPTPDGTWSSFTPIASSGGDIPGNSRYVQYRAQLNSGDPARTPVLSDVSIGYAPGADTTAPTISGRTPSPNATGVDTSGNVQVQFSEPMDAATINGSTVRLRKQGAGSDVPATVSYAGNTATLNPSSDLDPNGVYTVTVAGSVADQSGNQLGAADTWSFTTSPPIQNLVDTTVSDFSAGAPDANTYVSKTDDGEVTLQPTEGQEFSGGPGVPAGWQVSPWDLPSAGGSATVTGGQLVLNGAAAGPTQTYAAGHALEAKATFSGATFQHVGFGVDFNTQPYWAMFSIKSDGHLYARTNNNDAVTETQLSDSLIGSAHVFRVEWTATEVRYYVDGSLVATHTASIAVQMRPLASDLFNGDAGTVSVDWLRMSPYPGSGTFTSRVFDGTQPVNWKGLNWTAASPAGTGIALSVRTGDTPTPDGSWTSFAPLSGPGAQINASSRYLQYQAVLTSSDPNQTPTLNDVSIGYVAPPDTTAPTISQRTPSPNAVNVAPNGNVQVQFSEPMNPATIDGSTIRLRKQGAGSDVPASVTYSGNTATLDPSADLDFNSVYTVTVAGTVADQSGNQLGADDTWSFTTAPHTFGFTDTTVGDFGGGSPDANTYVSETDNGEVTLKPTEGQEFSGGPGLPAGWDSSQLGRRWQRHGFRGPAARKRLPGEHDSDLPAGPLARVQGDLRRGDLPARGLHLGQLRQRYLRDLQHGQHHRPDSRPHELRRRRAVLHDPRALAGHAAPLPDRVGRGRGPLLRRRGAGRHPHRQLRAQPASDRQRRQLGGPRARRRLAEDEPLPGLGHVRFAGLRRGRRRERQLGRAHLELGDAVRHRSGDERPHRGHPDA